MNSLSIDDLDIFILKEILNKKKISTWQMTLNYCINQKKDKEGMRIINKKHLLLKYRLKRFENLGIIIITKNQTNPSNRQDYTYNFIKEKIKNGLHRFPCGYRNSIALNLNNRWIVFEC